MHFLRSPLDEKDYPLEFKPKLFQLSLFIQDSKTIPKYYKRLRQPDSGILIYSLSDDQKETKKFKFIYNKQNGRDFSLNLFLISNFDPEKCKEIKGNAVILTNNNTAYFVLNGEIVMDEKHKVVTDIHRQEIPLCESDQLVKIEFPEDAVDKIIEESESKANYIHDKACEIVVFPKIKEKNIDKKLAEALGKSTKYAKEQVELFVLKKEVQSFIEKNAQDKNDKEKLKKRLKIVFLNIFINKYVKEENIDFMVHKNKLFYLEIKKAFIDSISNTVYKFLIHELYDIQHKTNIDQLRKLAQDNPNELDYIEKAMDKMLEFTIGIPPVAIKSNILGCIGTIINGQNAKNILEKEKDIDIKSTLKLVRSLSILHTLYQSVDACKWRNSIYEFVEKVSLIVAELLFYKYGTLILSLVKENDSGALESNHLLEFCAFLMANLRISYKFDYDKNKNELIYSDAMSLFSNDILQQILYASIPNPKKEQPILGRFITQFPEILELFSFNIIERNPVVIAAKFLWDPASFVASGTRTVSKILENIFTDNIFTNMGKPNLLFIPTKYLSISYVELFSQSPMVEFLEFKNSSAITIWNIFIHLKERTQLPPIVNLNLNITSRNRSVDYSVITTQQCSYFSQILSTPTLEFVLNEYINFIKRNGSQVTIKLLSTQKIAQEFIPINQILSTLDSQEDIKSLIDRADRDIELLTMRLKQAKYHKAVLRNFKNYTLVSKKIEKLSGDFDKETKYEIKNGLPTVQQKDKAIQQRGIITIEDYSITSSSLSGSPTTSSSLPSSTFVRGSSSSSSSSLLSSPSHSSLSTSSHVTLMGQSQRTSVDQEQQKVKNLILIERARSLVFEKYPPTQTDTAPLRVDFLQKLGDIEKETRYLINLAAHEKKLIELIFELEKLQISLERSSFG